MKNNMNQNYNFNVLKKDVVNQLKFKKNINK